jgi:uncharacterized protein (DUF2235 family)
MPMSKNIIFCADGTWNGPGQAEETEEVTSHTNIYKLFLNLDGKDDVETLNLADEQEKSLLNQNSELTQIVKYIHGVGDSKNIIHKIFGGAFGSGVIKRIVRGYTFISRNYNTGDKIFIIGFSRGAYTARALAGLIVSQGLLKKDLATIDNKEKAYRLGGAAWYKYRRASKKKSILSDLFEVAADLPAFVSQATLQESDMVKNIHVECVAVFDTVGAMGFPIFDSTNELVDAFQFADLDLSNNVHHGIHAVALDEQRAIFSPTLWNERANITQMLFCGAHADVGGGYPLKNNESGLSDITFTWMKDQLARLGVVFSSTSKYQITPNALGVAHKEWIKNGWKLTPIRARKFPLHFSQSSTISDRIGQFVQADPSEGATKYST